MLPSTKAPLSTLSNLHVITNDMCARFKQGLFAKYLPFDVPCTTTRLTGDAVTDLTTLNRGARKTVSVIVTRLFFVDAGCDDRAQPIGASECGGRRAHRHVEPGL